jgi:hypothetical protein
MALMGSITTASLTVMATFIGGKIAAEYNMAPSPFRPDS